MILGGFNSMPKELIISYYVGLGDNFITCGIVNFMSQFFDIVYAPVLEKYHKTVECLYQNNSKVKPCITTPEFCWSDTNYIKKRYNLGEITELSLHHGGNVNELEKKIYEKAKLPYSVRYDFFDMPTDIPGARKLYKKLVESKPYCLVSKECSVGQLNLKIKTNLPIVYLESGHTENALDFIDIIYGAKEIHCVDTAFYHLIEVMDVEADLYFHHARYPNDQKHNLLTPSDKWKIINYP